MVDWQESCLKLCRDRWSYATPARVPFFNIQWKQLYEVSTKTNRNLQIFFNRVKISAFMKSKQSCWFIYLDAVLFQRICCKMNYKTTASVIKWLICWTPTKNRLHKTITLLLALSDIAKKKELSKKKLSVRRVRPFGWRILLFTVF